MSLMSNVVQGQKELSLIGEESKKVEADMMMNARYLGSLEGLDIWLTKSDEGVKGLANKRDWHVVKFGDELVPMERADLPLTDHCRVLGAVGFEQNASGIHKASVLLVDSWTDQEAIDAHHASPMMETIATLREKYDLHMTVERFVSVEENTEDERFIRK